MRLHGDLFILLFVNDRRFKGGGEMSVFVKARIARFADKDELRGGRDNGSLVRICRTAFIGTY